MCIWSQVSANLVLKFGSSVVPISPVFGSLSPYKVTNPEKGTFMIRWFLGYPGSQRAFALELLDPFTLSRRFLLRGFGVLGFRV